MTEPRPEDMNAEAEENEELQRDPADPNAPTLEEALQQIEVLNKDAAEAKDKMLRALAEVENTRRRAEKDRQDIAKFSVTGFARDLLNVADNLRRALDAIPANQREGNAIYDGVAATERELLRVFEKNNIKKIESLGQKFDANLHEVIFEIPTADKEPGTIMQVVEAGYTIHERLLRPARVGVAKGADASSGNGGFDQQV